MTINVVLSRMLVIFLRSMGCRKTLNFLSKWLHRPLHSEPTGTYHPMAFYFCLLSNSFSLVRCFYIAETYRLAKKWAEATGLYDRCITRATSGVDQYAVLAAPIVEVRGKELL